MCCFYFLCSVYISGSVVVSITCVVLFSCVFRFCSCPCVLCYISCSQRAVASFWDVCLETAVVQPRRRGKRPKRYEATGRGPGTQWAQRSHWGLGAQWTQCSHRTGGCSSSRLIGEGGGGWGRSTQLTIHANTPAKLLPRRCRVVCFAVYGVWEHK